MTAARAPLTADQIVDEFVYVAADHTNHDSTALVAGLSIQRRPDRFTPLYQLTTAASVDTDPDTEP